MRNFGLLVILCAFTYATVSSAPIGLKASEADGQVENSTSTQAAFKLGGKIAESLSIGSWVFLGTITNVDKAKSEALGKENDRPALYAKISISVEEQLWGKDRGQPEVQMEYIPKPLAPRSSGPWEAWEGVDPQVGEKLIVALWDNSPNRPVYQGRPVDVALVVSEEALFPAIKSILAYHSVHISNPEAILQAPTLLDGKKSYVEAGYISTWLWRNTNPENVDNEVIVLSKLFARENFPEAGWGVVRIALMTRLMNDSYQLSNTTRNYAIKSIVNMGGSDNVKLSSHALTILLRLSDDSQIDIRPFLDEKLQRQLIRNYQKIAPAGGNARFESQIGLRRP